MVGWFGAVEICRLHQLQVQRRLLPLEFAESVESPLLESYRDSIHATEFTLIPFL